MKENMPQIDPHYHRWIGIPILKVTDEIQEECKKRNFTYSILDATFSQNIDVEKNRLNVLLNRDGEVVKIFFG